MMRDKGNVLRRGHGFQLDHVALAVADTQRGVDYVAHVTGVSPTLLPARPDSWFLSAALHLGENSFLEIIGPNPAHRGLHPMKGIMRAFPQPQLLFWYIATDDFDAYALRVEAAGGRIDQKQNVETESGAYTGAVMGPGFWSQRPCIIEWRRRPIQEAELDKRCRLVAFELAHPRAADLNQLFAALDIDTVVAKGRSRLAIELDTPNGRVALVGAGMRQTPWTMASALLRELTRGRR